MASVKLCVAFLAAVDGVLYDDQTGVSLTCAVEPKRGVVNRVVLRRVLFEGEGVAEAMFARAKVGGDREYAIALFPVAKPYEVFQKCGSSASKAVEGGHVVGDPVPLAMKLVGWEVTAPARSAAEVVVTFECDGAM